MIGISLGVGLQGVSDAGGGGIDADAQAFFDRVSTAGGTLSTTEKTAVNQLVLDMKSANIWTSMKAIYPMVGASAAACAQNLKSSSFTGTFSSGWTFANTGVTPNGTSAYMDTAFNPNTQLTFNSAHISYYSRTNNELSSSSTMGVNDSSNNEIRIILRRPTNTGFFISTDNTNGLLTYTITDSRGFFIGNANGINVRKYFKNSTLLSPNSAFSRGGSVFPDFSVYIGSRNSFGSANEFDNKECAFSSIGNGLTDTQASNFYTAVQAFQTTLNRQVGPQIVSDSDAQAYINRVYTAGGTLTNTEANAVNQLTIDMKAAGIWSSMKAVYPMVGASAAACAQNLKSSSFTGTFTSGWTFASTGVTPNGTNAYMDTNLNLNTMNSINDISYGYYSRTNSLSSGSFGWGVPTALSPSNEFWIRYGDGNKYGYLFDSGNDGGAVSDCRGFNAMSRIASTTKYIQLNSSIVTYSSASSGSLSSRNFIFAQGSQGYENRENALGFVANGLTSTNLSNFYTAVQTFQTTLSRQV